MKTLKYYLSLIAITIYIVCCFITYPIITSIIAAIIIWFAFIIYAMLFAVSHHDELDREWAKRFEEELNKDEKEIHLTGH